MPVVVDASALVELLLQRERAPAVLQAIGDTQMVAPDVINPEVLWALRRRERYGNLRADRAAQAVEDLMDAPMHRFPTLPLLPEVLCAGHRGPTPFPDAEAGVPPLTV